MLTHAHTCSHTRPPAGAPLADMCTRVGTCSHLRASSCVRTHAHTSSHMLTHAYTCSHMCTRAYTCSHVPHTQTRFPFPALTGFALGSYLLCFTMVFEHIVKKRFLNLTKMDKTFGTVSLFERCHSLLCNLSLTAFSESSSGLLTCPISLQKRPKHA